MGALVNADEVFAMAVQIENNGARFYRLAAAKFPDRQQNAYLLGLAEMEDEHERIFVKMREDLATQEGAAESGDLNAEGALFLAAVGAGQAGEGTPAAASRLTGKESLVDVLRMAIGFEMNSILFYLGLKDVVSAWLGTERIDKIIDEEKSHVVILAGKLRDVERKPEDVPREPR